MANILFVQKNAFPLLGPMYISAVLKNKGHNCNLAFGNIKYIIKRIKSDNPNLILFSSMTHGCWWVNRVAGYIKKEGIKIPIVLGGQHATYCRESVIEDPYIDIICIGEGEEAILELAECLDDKKDIRYIQNLWVKKERNIFKNRLRPLIKDLNNLPYPDRDLYYNASKRKAIFPVFMASRGCPYLCTYCFNHTYNKLYSEYKVRYREVNNIISEILYVINRYDIYPKLLIFYDSSFTFDKSWTISFLSEYRNKVNLPFIFNTRVDLLDEEIIKQLAGSNCRHIQLGIESGSELLRKNILEKNITNEQIIAVTQLFKKYKLPFLTFNMFCLPDESFEDALKTIELNQRIQPDRMLNHLFMPLPNLELTNYALRKSIVKENDIKKMSCGLYEFHTILEQKDIRIIENLCKLSYIAVKYPRSLKVIKKMVFLPLNFVFDIIYAITYYLDAFRVWKVPGSILCKSVLRHIILIILGKKI